MEELPSLAVPFKRPVYEAVAESFSPLARGDRGLQVADCTSPMRFRSLCGPPEDGTAGAAL